MNCSVCDTPNTNKSSNCGTCGWYFSFKDTLELGRAKQQYQMISSFNRIFQHMQVQSKMLEKINFRLDKIENQITTKKENKPKQAIIKKYDYPVLKPIMKAEGFDTPEKRAEWWNGLEKQWQKAFKQAVLQKKQSHKPNDKDYQLVLDSKVVRLVGQKGMHASIDFELTNLSGLKHLTRLTIVVASQNALTDLKGIEHLKNLKSLFVDNNELTSIEEVNYLPQLKKFYCNSNQITNIQAVILLTKLDTLYCSCNQLINFDGITEAHTEYLKEFVCLPNAKISPKAIQRIENIGIFCKKG